MWAGSVHKRTKLSEIEEEKVSLIVGQMGLSDES